MNKFDNYFTGKSVSLIGAGISNLPLAEQLVKCCSSVTVRDKKSRDDLGESADTLEKLGIKLILGEGYLENITEDVVFRSPGIRPDISELKDAVSRGTVLTSEMEFFLSLEPCRIYGITGSDGKSTTTTLTYMMLNSGNAYNTFLGGNIGKPLLDRYSLIHSADSAAVELSSFQLMTIDAPIEVAAITNITPNHLNWHTSMDEYIEAKKHILRRASRAVLNYDNEITRRIAEEVQKTDTPVTFFSLSPIPDNALRPIDSKVWLENDVIYSYFPDCGKVEIMPRKTIKLPGLHNTANYMTAIAVTWGRCDTDKIREIAADFGGVEHRLEFVRKVDGVNYINGSIDSSPTRTAAALSAINDRPVVLIAGGYDKHIPYEPLADAVYSSSVHTAVLTGDTAPAIKKALLENVKHSSSDLKIIDAPSFEDAVRLARESARVGDTVILSPASASFDRFKNFEERGKYFKKLVNEMQPNNMEE